MKTLPRALRLLFALGVCLALLWLNVTLTLGAKPATPAATAASDPLADSPGSRDVSLPDSAVFADGKPVAAARGDATVLLAKDDDRDTWSAGSAAGPTTFAYRIAFTKPVTLGSLILRGTAQKIAVLKPDAPFPGDPLAPEQWITTDLPPRQSLRAVAPLPSVVATRAVLLLDTRDRGVSELRSIQFLPRRLFNATPLATAYGDAEWTLYPSMGSPVTYAASALTGGYGHWQNRGPNKENRVTTPEISDIHPAWFILAWDEAQTLSGLWMRDNLSKFELDIFVGPDSINPRAGTEAEWKRIRPAAVTNEDGGHRLTLAPVKTRGVRLRITQTSDPSYAAKISAIHALIDLGENPRPQTPANAASPAPVQVKYTLDADAEVSVVINRPDGTRVRNLIARAWRKKGEQSEAWDLKDESGQLVPPGNYPWQVLSHPPLELRYEMTPYPNVQNFFAESAPWPTGSAGEGGWATNHTPPSSVAAVGGRVYIGSYTAEGGSALLEAELTGKKTWGTGNFAAWTGPQFLAGDGGTVYAQARVVGSDVDNVYAVNIATKRITTPLSLRPSGTRDRKVTGMAAAKGLITLSCASTPRWLDSAPQPDDVDFLACYPKYPEKRKERVPHEIIPDPRTDWLRLFRLTDTPNPPGQRDGDGFLTTIESSHGSGPRQYAVLAFKRPIALGGVIFPQPLDPKIEVRISTLKPDAPFPANPGDPKLWTPFQTQAKRAWDVATAGNEVVTRALRIAFVKGGDDLFTDGDDSAAFIADDKSMTAESKKSVLDGGGENWHGRLEGMKIFRRRFANVAGDAAVRVSSGTVAADGSWDARRSEPLSPEKPGVYLMEWKTPQKLRGLAFKEVDGKTALIDIFTGADNAPLSLDGNEGWEKIADYRQARRKHRWGGGNLTEQFARYMDGYVEFGREVTTRAVRIRVTEQWMETGSNPQYGLRTDQGGMTLDPTRCRIFGVAALQYLGGELPVDPLMNERLETFDAASGKLVGEVAIERPGQIAADPQGTLVAVSKGKIVRVDPHGKHTTLIEDVNRPAALAVDASSNIYVFDAGIDRHPAEEHKAATPAPLRSNIRVYDAAGRLLRTIGEPGGRQVGAWNPLRMQGVSSLAVDESGQVWATEANYWPKRVVVWDAAGKFVREIVGPTEYGGGGVLDPWDKTRMFYGPLEFALDWQTGQTAIKNWSHASSPAGEQPIHLDGRVYLVNRPAGSHSTMKIGVVYLLENNVARLVAAMGDAEEFDLLKPPAVRAALGRPILKNVRFLWSDLNADGAVQPSEVAFADMTGDRPNMSVSNFGNDLSTHGADLRYEVEKVLPTGVPVYRTQPLALNQSRAYSGAGTLRLDNGNYITIGAGGKPQSSITPTGKAVWTYPSEGAGVHALYSAKPWTPAQVVSEFAWVGHETAHAGDLGEFLVTTSNVGTWNIWTADGILAGQIFRDIRDPRRQAWSMSEATRGVLLKDITVGQEHFQGYFCRSRTDNRYYAVAGHIHASVVEVIGLDRFKRQRGEQEVTPRLIVETTEWDRAREKRAVYQRSPVVDCYRLKAVPILSDPADWGFTSAEIDDDTRLSIGYTDKDLFVRYVVRDQGPMKNAGDQWDQLFKTGASVDVQMGVDPGAPDDRKAPGAGDFRLLMTFAQGKPTAVLYQPVVPGTPAEKAWKVVSPVAETSFDRVTNVTGVQMATRELEDGAGYIMQAAIPLDLIGLKPAPGLRLRMDWGVLISGKDGREVLQRRYWSNKATAIISDAPSEAAIFPNLWGHIRFMGQRGDRNTPPGLKDTKQHATDKQVDELLDDMENERK